MNRQQSLVITFAALIGLIYGLTQCDLSKPVTPPVLPGYPGGPRQ